ncbi:hypothetical protein TIFTF001_032154 [Ficus carica]|uniref:Expansin-like EG45 domain-containing protein n=1 Tax=Ficus carica TaxID=3494 RepID=A0AA88DZZ4_FICCA|nr:hypothetical protein TIFTF001_032154 [Ficus carica]
MKNMAMLQFQCFIFVAIATLSFYSSFTSIAYAQETGTATYYTAPYQPSSCYGFEDQGVMIAAASDAFYNDGEACGQTYEVTCLSGTNLGTPMPCLGGSVVVKIVDYCKPGSCREK